MASHRDVWRLLQRGLTGEAVAKIVIAEAERLHRGDPPLWSDAELERLKHPLARDSNARHAYARVINRWCQEQGIESTLDEIDPPSEASLEAMVRWHIIDRHRAYEAPKHAALESYVEAGGWMNWRQHPWVPSGILPVPADPEGAWLDFCEWCRDGPYHSAVPLMPKETYQRIFSENKPYHRWELRPSEPENPST
jgi:hypothetical protein